ncbi:hypothetical protein DFJ63DRAFT_109420 [Scheffersomyces coipomensis]|uniref:uncharacterized protein n=1 Tax=Scheffersomyces coipomensis TaxID=1788519 RepID=UPI00315C8E3D
MIEYCQKYDGKRTFDIFYSEDDKPKSGEEEDSQDHKRVASPIKSDFIIEESTNHQKRFKYTQVVIDFISDEIRTFKALKEAVPKVKEFLEHKVGKLDACDEYDQFIRLLESSINAIISKLLKLTGLSKLKQDYSDLMKLNVFQLVYNARLDRFDLGYILSEIFFQNSNLESLFLRYYCKLSFC